MMKNHNINAVKTYNKLNDALKIKFSAMTRQATGMRINSEADDAAGASISEKIKAQIRGLEQASRNIQDGISLVQTAEAELGSIHNPNLTRMKKLTLQALNETLTNQDRQKIQLELNNIIDSIDDIANSTEFNTVKVLALPVKKVAKSPPLVNNNSKADIVFLVDNTGSMSGTQTIVANNITNFITSITAKGVTDIRMGVIEYEGSKKEIKEFLGSK